MIRTVAFPAFFLALTLCLRAADLSGQWTGVIDVRDESSGSYVSTTVKLVLTKQGGQLSGTIGRTGDPEEVPLKNVKITGAKLTFEAANGETSEPCKFTLAVNGDRMEGEMVTSLDASVLIGKVKISRAPSEPRP